MNKFHSAFCVGAFAVGLLFPAMSWGNHDDELQLRRLESRLAEAFADKKIDQIMQAYAQDVFVFDLTTPRQYVGASAYRRSWEGLLAGFEGPIKVELSDLVVSENGTVGYGHKIHHVIGTGARGNKIELTVRISDVYLKQHDDWVIVQEHVSVPLDARTMTPDLMSRP
jgi:ketosteroid isomerase-like protein